MSNKKKLLFIYQLINFYPWTPTFIKEDIDLLQDFFNVKTIRYSLLKTMNLFFEIKNTDIVFIWFGGVHAFIATIFAKIIKKPIVIIVGGYDVADEKELKYGMLLNPITKYMVKYALSNANRVLTVDDGLKIDAITKLNISGNNIITIPTGYDFNKFVPKGKKEKIVLLVSAGRNLDRIKLKGVDTFVKSAKFLPHAEFYVIGAHGNVLKKLKEISPPNVKLMGPIIQKDLIKYYQKAKVICQLSLREGLANVLCEAMLCECIPVGTNVQGITTAIGDTGFYVNYNDIEGTANAIKQALISKKGKEARNRVITLFSRQLREKRLVDIIEEMIK